MKNSSIKIALWTHPRSTSTAVERAFRERTDTFVLYEPFARAYYTGPNRLTKRFISEKKSCATTYDSVIKKILTPYPKPITFFKDMAYYQNQKIDTHFFSQITNTFLIRNPQHALISHYKISPDFYFYPEESGYFRLAEIFKLSLQNTPKPPIVIDAQELCNDPIGILNAYCHALNIPFSPQMLDWRQSAPDDWHEWKEWHTKASISKGFEALTQHNPIELPNQLQDLIHACKQPYQELFQHRLKSLPYEPMHLGKSCSF